jgi:hypothetical protein
LGVFLPIVIWYSGHALFNALLIVLSSSAAAWSSRLLPHLGFGA